VITLPEINKHKDHETTLCKTEENVTG
jgi:hypothetical protein